MDKVLSVNSVVKYFHNPQDFQVLKGITFDVNKGEFISVVGKSGSGKSTLLYLLSTMDTDYEGTISVNGTNVTEMGQNQLAAFRNEHIGFVFQFHFLLPDFSVADNVMLPALKLGRYPKEVVYDKAVNLLKLLDVSGQEDKKASRLSGGQQQRVAIARALINDPSIIMADEPTGNLDSHSSIEIMNIFSNLHEQEKTVILVTHEPDIAEYAKRVITVRDGMIISDEIKEQ